jgi:hypothetical protein
MIKIINQIKNKKHIEYYLISIILVLGFIVRLYKINNPVADWHSWRQADTASVTRLYIQDGINIFYPRYHDISSIQTGTFNPKGYRFVEFPIYNVIHAFLAKSFPNFSLEVWGRLVSVFAFLVSCYLIFLLGKRFIGKWGALLASFFYAFLPFNIYFTRVILPEPLGVAFGLASLWFFVKFIDKKKYWLLYLSSINFALALLIKPFFFFYGMPIAYLAMRKYGFKGIFKDIKILIALDVALVPFFAWRTWINQYPVGIPHWKWAFNGDRIRFRPAFWRWIFGERLGRLILGIWGLVPFSFGILTAKRRDYFNLFFILGMFLYVVTFATANIRHDYYQTIVIPAISLILGQGAISMWRTKEFRPLFARSLLIFSIIMMFGISAYQIKEFYKINHPEIIAAGKVVDEIVPKDALVIAPYNGDTAFLYQTKRSGWPVLELPVDQLIERGASYYVSVNYDKDTADVMKRFEVIEKNPDFVIVKLK